MKAESFSVKGAPRLRSLALAAVVCVAGMGVMLLAGQLNGGPGWIAAGVVLAAAGIVLALVAQDAARKSAVLALLSDEGFVLTSRTARLALAWADVRRVSMVANHLIITDAHGKEASVVAPAGARLGDLDTLGAALAARLDAHRGYHTPDFGA